MEADEDGKELYFSQRQVKGRRVGYKDKATTNLGTRKITKDAVAFVEEEGGSVA